MILDSNGFLDVLKEDMTLCMFVLDNEVYANTGGQRSSSTPIGASTTTAPAGSPLMVKKTEKKDIVSIMAAHGSSLCCSSCTQINGKDMVTKIQKGFSTYGPVFINAMSV